MGKENRAAPRFDFGLRVTLANTGKAYFTRDISAKGCFLPSDQSLNAGDLVDLIIDVPGFGEVNAAGKVAHVSDAGAGIMFLKLSNPRGQRALLEFLRVVSLCEVECREKEVDWLN
ncbi:MAG: PilZ domain-containing protein [Pseudomonadota bacterium]